ncbi:peptidoglycan-binding domain-containing protein [Microbacterium sp. YY-01]|uniref:peptidoglycan-binding domain-containing protein n=1 Tax=Microbacterium sp. YY-01 TaxID=3421634 RepID=UPI003D167A9A
MTQQNGNKHEQAEVDALTTLKSARRYRWQGAVLGAVIAAVLAGAGVWAGLTVLQPAEDPLAAKQYTYVEVSEGEVSSQLALNTIAQWRTQPVGENRAAGVVTSVNITAGDEVNVGSTLYSVNLRPVVIGQGSIPAFRAIGEGAEGPDVTQLQEMLGALGFYHYAADGKAEGGTVSAIRAWQESLGLEQTGQVDLGDVVFVPSLPARIALDTEHVATGNTLNGGEPVIRGLSSTPAFTLPVTDAQAAMIPTGTRVELTSPEGNTWTAFSADQERDKETEALTVTLRGMDGASICGDGCGQIPVSGQAQLVSRIITVEPVTGLVVPSAALVTDANGDTMLIDANDKRHPVTVIAAAKGMSVIEGVDAGLRVRVPAETSDKKP